MGDDRCRGAGGRPARGDHRHAPARQAQADLHPHIDTGDNIIVVNADKVVFTGNKRDDKTYYWHTGYPGGIKQRKAHQILDGRFPERILEAAVRRMMPDGPLARQQLKNLRIYNGPEHPHEAQSPEVLDVASRNVKNTLRG
jgi:large subunit ribosomal protein L13